MIEHVPTVKAQEGIRPWLIECSCGQLLMDATDVELPVLMRIHLQAMTDTDRLYNKYEVKRTDGRDGPGGDKADARYFVLDYVHDPHARKALSAYAESIHSTNYDLACDLRGELIETRGG